MTTTQTTQNGATGLEGVIAARTRLSSVDGQKGELIIAGFPVEALAGQATFEETVYLLWEDRLPDRGQLDAFRASLAARRTLPEATLELLRAAAARRAPAMDALRMAAGSLSLAGDEAGDHAGEDSRGATGGHGGEGVEASLARGRREALGLIARFPTIVAAYARMLEGSAPIPPRADLGHAANYLYMLTGDTPTEAQTRGLETYLNTVVDHGLNASTFTARVIVSTRSDMVSAVVGAIGALKGPLHGGAPGPALDMVFEIGEASRAESWLRARIERGERLMGFGHRVYKVRDPRAEVLSAAAARLMGGGDSDLYRLAREVEATAVRLLEEYKPGRNLQTNVEFYTALLLHGLGLSTDLFTPTFAIGRVGGWTAHCLEQIEADRLIRPQSAYTGERDRLWSRIEARG